MAAFFRRRSLCCSHHDSRSTAAHADLNITSNPTANVDCTSKKGVCKATAKNANLNAIDLVNLLAKENVKVEAKTGTNVNVESALAWASRRMLTLESQQKRFRL